MLKPEEFEQLFNAYNKGFTDDILSSSDKFDRLKDINKETRKAIANKRAENLIQAGLTPNLDAFMPESYTRWNHWRDEDDRDTIMDTLSYANTLLEDKDFSNDSLKDFSTFILNLYSNKSIKKKYSKDDLYRIYTYFSGLGLNDELFDKSIIPITSNIFPKDFREPYRDYRAYAKKSLQAGATAPTFETFLEDKVLGNPEASLDNKLNTLKQIQEGTYIRTTPDPVSEPPANIPKTTKDNEVTTPKVEAKPIEPKKDFYSMIKDEYNQDEKVRSKYHKLGWWK